MVELEIRDAPPAQDDGSDILSAPKSLHEIFPPVSKSHILNCAFAAWHPLYRSLTPKARTIPLTPEFLSYLREDGIVLPDDEEQTTTLSDSDTEDETETETEDEDADERSQNPTARFPTLHQQIKTTLRELGGSVAPKLSWSAPKDAAFMTATNSLECRTPGEIYLLLKSSSFITHDLEHAFDDCSDPTSGDEAVPHHLVLRKWFAINPSLEFRVFVASRRILAISQRDPNHYPFLQGLQPALTAAITSFFVAHLAPTSPDADFVFDVYVAHRDSEPTRVWLIDINPFAPHTDALLFSWVEILRLRNGEKEEGREAEMRLVGRDDPEARFAGAQYGASKLPREVVEVGLEGEEAVWEFARRWRDIVERTERAAVVERR